MPLKPVLTGLYNENDSSPLPAGGSTGQVLEKASNADYDVTWGTVSGTGTVTSVSGSGGTTGLTLTGGPITTTGTLTLGGQIVTGAIADAAVTNAKLANSSVTVNGTSIALGASGTVTAAAGTLTGSTLNSGVTASSLTSVGTLTGGATGAGFTIALSTSTVTGTLADARLSANVPLLNATNAFTGSMTIGGTGVTSAIGLTVQVNDTVGNGAVMGQTVNSSGMSVVGILAKGNFGGMVLSHGESGAGSHYPNTWLIEMDYGLDGTLTSKCAPFFINMQGTYGGNFENHPVFGCDSDGLKTFYKHRVGQDWTANGAALDLRAGGGMLVYAESAETTGTGTITASGFGITGSGTSFTTQLVPGAIVSGTIGAGTVLNVASNTSATLDNTITASGASFTYSLPVFRVNCETANCFAAMTPRGQWMVNNTSAARLLLNVPGTRAWEIRNADGLYFNDVTQNSNPVIFTGGAPDSSLVMSNTGLLTLAHGLTVSSGTITLGSGTGVATLSSGVLGSESQVTTAQGGTGVDNSTGGTANTFWARPNGATGAAAYRAIVAADLPSTLTSGTAITNAALTTPTLGTPASGTLTNCSGTAASLTAGAVSAGGAATLGTEQASTSGTTITFTSVVPSGAKRIIIHFKGVSTNGSSDILVRIGTGGGLDTTGYVSAAAGGAASPAGTSSTVGFILTNGANSASHIYSGNIVLCLEKASSNTWTESHSLGRTGTAGAVCGGGYLDASGTVDTVRIMTANGTDTFDAGNINISWE